MSNTTKQTGERGGLNAQSEPTKEQSLLSAIEGNFEGMAKSDLVLTCQMLTRGREAWRKEAEELKSKLETPSCFYVQHGRGDCEHFIGLPKDMNEKTTDTYGKPNGWCWFCWLSFRLAKATPIDAKRLQEATRILEAMSEWLDEDRMPDASTLMPDSEQTFGAAIRDWLLYRLPATPASVPRG